MSNVFYGNTPQTGFANDFFTTGNQGIKTAFLAAPFLTTSEPIVSLAKNGADVRLIVRLCSVTSPEELQKCMHADIRIKFFTSDRFHAKIFILDDHALVGSSNLTGGGLMNNREFSVRLERGENDAFEGAQAYFQDLWNDAATLGERELRVFASLPGRQNAKSHDTDFSAKLEAQLGEVIAPAGPRKDDTHRRPERLFLDTMRRKYEEVITPPYIEIREAAELAGLGRSGIYDDLLVEFNQFLAWIRERHGGGQKWLESPIRNTDDIAQEIDKYVEDWNRELAAGQSYWAKGGSNANVANLREALSDRSVLYSLDKEALFDSLLGCHAFASRRRFFKGGPDTQKAVFWEANTLTNVQQSLLRLSDASIDPLERACDLVYDTRWKIAHFGESCVIETIGLLDHGLPPANARTLRGLRFLGCDLQEFEPSEE